MPAAIAPADQFLWLKAVSQPKVPVYLRGLLGKKRGTTNAEEEHQKCSAESGKQPSEPGILSSTAARGAAKNVTDTSAAQAAALNQGRQVGYCYLLPSLPASVCSSFGQHF